MEHSNYYAPRKRKNKYNAKMVEQDGHKFHSIAERRYYNYLKKQLEDGKIIEFKMQVPYVIFEGSKYKIKYIADFVVTYKDGETKVIDVKGSESTLTDVFKLKSKLFYEYYGKEIICVKQVNKRWVEF